MKGINKVILIGNCGADPDVRSMPDGKAVTNISVATTESWRNKDNGNQETRTEWHRVVFFGRLAEIAGEYLSKGSKVYIEGSNRTRKWQDNSGQDRYTTEVVAKEMQMLDSRGQSQQVQDAPQQQQMTPQPAPQETGGGDFFDDDIPFNSVPWWS